MYRFVASSKLKIAGIIKDRMEIIAALVKKDDRVLDLGVVDSRRGKHETEARLSKKLPNSLFHKLHQLNPSCIGVDIDEEGVEILRAQGFDARYGDVITMDLGESFDTIVAGEIIEHLPDAGQFLRNMAKHLKPQGNLIITTPNPFYSKQAWKIWRYNAPQVHEEHVCWFDPITLSHLCRLSGLDPYRIYWVQPRLHFKALPSKLRSFFSHSFLIVARRAS